MNALPLLERVDARGVYAPAAAPSSPAASPAKIPCGAPGAGEQYRFHFDMTLCIGCKCCVVACSEQNNNPAGVFWRKVGEVEGGQYPKAFRSYISMSCNHCLQPACLIGCPVDAYEKSPLTGLVLHDPEQCIGCQYCTWNCPYGAPQFNAERKVVGKCDMCHSRLADGMEPACVAACPQDAISIELVDVESWLTQAAPGADAPELPSSSITVSTTRITIPKTLPGSVLGAGSHLLEPEEPHAPLVFMTALTQISLGAIAAVAGLDGAARIGRPALNGVETFPPAALGAFVCAAGLTGSLWHLGRPLYALRAFKGWRRSWLSREAIGLSAFMALAGARAALGAFPFVFGFEAGASLLLTVSLAACAAGAAGVYCSAMIYRVPARPSWNSSGTIPHFFLGGGAVGLLATAAFATAGPSSAFRALTLTAGALGLAEFFFALYSLFMFLNSEDGDLRRTGLLYARRFRTLTATRFAVWLAFGTVAPVAFAFAPPSAVRCAVAALMAAIALAVSRHLFFVTVAPRRIPGSFFFRAEGGRP